MSHVSAFKTPEGEARFYAAYDAALKRWPVPYEEMDIPTRFGTTHVVASGPKDASPLVLLHGYWATSTKPRTHCRISGTRELTAAANRRRPQLLPKPSNQCILFSRLFVFGVMTSQATVSINIPSSASARSLAHPTWTAARLSLEPISRSQIERPEVAHESESRMVDHRA
jgi:hypothetical protein